MSKLLVILEVELNRNLEGVLKYLTAAMKYSGFENSEQILGEINGVPAGGRGSCQIFYPQDLAHRMYRHFDIFIKNAKSEINNTFCCSLKISGWSEVKRLGRGVQVEQGHQLPSQPARC